ncbi:pro-sigmaK processing inhibitor BofA [Pontibacillus yanchengensis]|uniref:Pro-sigmaK processing inhibitor BofA n=2 Tax=Pontibacillus yanchengensis TaxID=462910 RepID=A0A6I4ZZH7_9BACI|nr:pro-sigmaK processing inhibitor BofA family protein [Pontibacillus yanchengensis]MYL34396.1 pro-sigmaK processing inhibitor BofA [Pontibacillus yanchengensis]MYL54204.1 pro-sigmaK processing inhibitor BofA [Pontibacillus yanchengensis]
MVSTAIIIGIFLLIGFLLVAGAPMKPVRFIANGAVKVVIGVLFLFFFNVFGASFGLHIPINAFTAIISGFLGIPGLASLIAIHLFVL